MWWEETVRETTHTHTHTLSLSLPHFSTISMPDDGATSEVSQYIGTAAIGATVYFAPFDEDNIGVLDTTDDIFSVISTSQAGVVDDKKYGGCAAVGPGVLCAARSRSAGGTLSKKPAPSKIRYPSASTGRFGGCCPSMGGPRHGIASRRGPAPEVMAAVAYCAEYARRALDELFAPDE